MSTVEEAEKAVEMFHRYVSVFDDLMELFFLINSGFRYFSYGYDLR
jgi:hypothetical protein